MNKKILKLETINFINQLDWNALSCFDRSLAIISENLKQNSLFYYLLFKPMFKDYLERDLNLSIGDDKYYETIQKKTNVSYNLKTESIKKDIVKTLINKIDKNFILMLVTNNFYRKGSMSFNKENHPHFIILKGYNVKDKVFYILDEDLSKNYSKTENFKDGVQYIDQIISFEDMVLLMSNITCFSKFKGFENIFAYYEFKNRDDFDECDFSEILDLLKKECEECAKLSEFKFVKDILDEHVKSLDVNKKLTIGDINYLKNWLVYPGVLAKIGWHHIQLNILKKFLSIKVKNVYLVFENDLKNLLDFYEDIRLLACKMEIFQDKSCVTILEEKLKEVFPKEKVFYLKLRNSLEEIKIN